MTDPQLRGRWASDLAKWMFAAARDVDTVGVRGDVVRLTRVAGGVEHVAEANIGASLSEALERALADLGERVRRAGLESNGSS